MSPDERTKLWETYSKKPTLELREQLINEYIPLVKIVAGRLMIYFGNKIEFDELVSCGCFGLLDAFDKFKYEKGVKFETYASLRIRGAIIDEVRKYDPLSRGARQKQKQLDQAYRDLETQFGRTPKEEEVAAYLGITTDELYDLMQISNASNIISLDDFVEDNGDVGFNDIEDTSGYQNPENGIVMEERKAAIIKALDELTDNEKKVITLYYYEEMTLKEIALVMEVSESRVSQLHSRAIQKLKVVLGKNIELFF
ncbi:MAG: FliA/WhiG family RNA polymerase sigma factor [Lachnospiraceae bacterium]|nr:FliA/WhiG family RNA polymerase sigma factor [Lachnospiraceae bacterium]